MIAELGHIALILAGLCALLQSILPAIGLKQDHNTLIRFAEPAAKLQAVLLILSFGLLTAVFLGSDFSVKLAVSHSHSAKPLIYKISGVWGNHEGSILLWTVLIGVYGALFAALAKSLPERMRAATLACQGALGAGFIAFVLFTSNPFERLNPVPLDGQGLNPLLQDPGLAIHPPLLYFGYVGLSLAFSMAVAALALGQVDRNWGRALKPWVLLAWSFLTLGITVGSIWAYYELGWGGWWMWDPVENVSFMPWLIATALLHSIMVLERKATLAHWTVLLAISAFSLAMIGTFVVRSGVLVSVHAFATDPARGVFILLLLLGATGGALTLYALRAKALFTPAGFDRLSREGGLVLNNILLATATVTVFLGTFYPLFIDAADAGNISVGAPYFDLTFAPIMSVLIIFMGSAPLLRWQKGQWREMKILLPAIILLALALIISVVSGFKVSLAVFGVALGLYLIFGAVIAFLRRKITGGMPFLLGHVGVGIFVIGAVVMSAFAKDTIARVPPGGSVNVYDYTFTLEAPRTGTRDNYQFQGANIRVSKDGRPDKSVYTEQRFYPVRNQITTEAGFDYRVSTTVFAALGEGTNEDGYILRAHVQPLVTWIWFGALLMSLGGFWAIIPSRRPQKLSEAAEAG